MNRIDFLHKLTSGKAVIHKVTLIPGETLEIFFDDLSKRYRFDKEKLFTYYKKYSTYPEAGIFADTYYVPAGIKEKHLIHFLVRESEKKYKHLSEKLYGSYDPRQWQKILTTASIIQKEAANNTKVTPERIKDDNTTFNTYKFKGLPPSPIGAVSLSAIKAAVKPAKTDYLYFMKNQKGTHDFSKSFRAHRKNIQKAKKE